MGGAGVRIGIDFDNTIVRYDGVFERAARSRGLLPDSWAAADKTAVRDHLRRQPDGEKLWQGLQGWVYGKGISEAEPFPGVADFLAACRGCGAVVSVVSHKTRYGHQDPERVDLREAKTLGFVHADAIGGKIIDHFNEGGFDVCTLFYSEFKSVISQVPTALQVIPAASLVASSEPENAGGNAVYEYEPEPGEILSDLIPRNISVQVFRALLENAAGEMGAKMSAIDNATRNAGEMINKLTVKYNRQRQANITKELIEIISGAEAL